MARALHIIPSLAQGGAERVLVDVVTHTDDVEHAVLLLEDLPDFYRLPDSVRVYRLGISTARRGSTLRRLMAAARAGLILLRLRPTVVVGWSYVGHVAAATLRRYLGIRSVWTCHFPLPPSPGEVTDPVEAQRLETYRRLAPWADAIHVPSERLRVRLAEHGIVERVTVISHAVDVSRFQSREVAHA